MALGAAEYLIKPVGRQELLGALARVGAISSDAAADPRALKERL